MVSQLSTRGRDEILSPRIHRLHTYWDSKRLEGEPIPYRRHIEPGDLRDILPWLSICDVEYGPLRFRYRLVGTRVVEYNHQEFTGLYLGEVGWHQEQLLLAVYQDTVIERRPQFGEYAWELQTGAIGRCEFGMFPLLNDEDVIHQVIAIEDYEFPARDVDTGKI